MPGGARGIGRAVALSLAGGGWRVAVAARRETDESRSLRAALGDGHDVALCDVSDEAATRGWVEAVTARLGEPDALVHAAGPFARGPRCADDVAGWRRTFADNLFAAVGLAGLVAPGMRDRAWGRVVVFGHAGVATLRPPPTIAAWYAAKAGLLCFARALASEMAGHGVTVNCVSPGVIDTGGMDPATFDRVAAQVPGGAAGRPDDVAALVRWLLSDESAHVTGAEITVAGGWDLPRVSYKSGYSGRAAAVRRAGLLGLGDRGGGLEVDREDRGAIGAAGALVDLAVRGLLASADTAGLLGQRNHGEWAPLEKRVGRG